MQVEVRARMSHEGVTQVFIGIYDGHGVMLCEEFHDRDRDEPCCAVLKWGTQRARDILAETQGFVAPHRGQLTLGPVITDESVLALRRMEMSEHERT
jgi:hypothetical protein